MSENTSNPNKSGCPSCGEEFSNRKKNCPSCGFSLSLASTPSKGGKYGKMAGGLQAFDFKKSNIFVKLGGALLITWLGAIVLLFFYIIFLKFFG
ncbi:MAG: hypothetical protein ABIA04_07500 [Pseudomonadota bacterium]